MFSRVCSSYASGVTWKCRGQMLEEKPLGCLFLRDVVMAMHPTPTTLKQHPKPKACQAPNPPPQTPRTCVLANVFSARRDTRLLCPNTCAPYLELRLGVPTDQAITQSTLPGAFHLGLYKNPAHSIYERSCPKRLGQCP